MCRPSVAAPPPLWLAAVRSYSKDHVQHAAHQKRQAAAVDQADVAPALREAPSPLRRRVVAEQAKILYAEAKENHSDDTQWHRWHHCSLCEQHYHGVVKCALGWACWKTYVGRPEADWARRLAMSVLGNGLSDAKHDEEALSVQEAELSMLRRLGGSERSILVTQGNLACTYPVSYTHLTLPTILLV